MDKIKKTIRPSVDFSESERIKIIEEYLSNNIRKVDIWRKYTGYEEEHGGLLKWMKQLGFTDNKPRNSPKLALHATTALEPIIDFTNLNPEDLQKRIKDLEKLLLEAQVKAESCSLIIEIAENELKIPIRKKPNTK